VRVHRRISASVSAEFIAPDICLCMSVATGNLVLTKIENLDRPYLIDPLRDRPLTAAVVELSVRENRTNRNAIRITVVTHLDECSR
jgi:hypothetical protein